MRVLVIDGQGGGLGRQLVTAITALCPEAELTAVGTNSMAASAMLKAGAARAATGENAVVVNARRADIIVGPIGIVIADALLGEITPAMAAAPMPATSPMPSALARSTRSCPSPSSAARCTVPMSPLPSTSCWRP